MNALNTALRTFTRALEAGEMEAAEYRAITVAALSRSTFPVDVAPAVGRRELDEQVACSIRILENRTREGGLPGRERAAMTAALLMAKRAHRFGEFQ